MNNRKEDYTAKVKHLMEISCQPIGKCIDFIEFVQSYLDSCGYFHSDYNIHGFEKPNDWINYSQKDFGTWLLDMALQYNMEQGVEYKYELINDKN